MGHTLPLWLALSHLCPLRWLSGSATRRPRTLFGEILRQELDSQGVSIRELARRLTADEPEKIENTRRELSWKPRVAMKEALRRIYDAYRTHVAEAKHLVK